MSYFGDGRNNMNYLYDNIDEFFKEGTMAEFYEVLAYYFENNDFIKED